MLRSDKVYIGIDPGISGGVAAIRHNADGSKDVMSHKYPKSIEDLSTIISLFSEDTDPENVSIVLEQVSSMPRQGVKSVFTFGVNYGIWMGVLETMEMSYLKIRPKLWQSKFDIPKNIDYRSRKNYLKGVAKRLFPSIKVTLYVADALLIAKYCEFMNNKKQGA